MNHSDLRIGFIGGGNMARAMISGLLRAGHAATRISVADPDAGQRQAVSALDKRINASADNDAVAAAADVLVLAVKPQIMGAVATALGDRPGSQLVLSIAAGLTLATLARWLGADTAVVRAMPNQPALVGAGMTVLAAAAAVTPEQRNQASYVASAAGETGWVEDEALIDAVTAVSGSGPAYFYLLMELLEAGARDLGLAPELARQLAVQTAYGAGLSARESNGDPAALRRSVTSPGGTTEAAIASLESGGIRDIVSQALLAARDRSIELGAPPTDSARRPK